MEFFYFYNYFDVVVTELLYFILPKNYFLNDCINLQYV